MRIERYLNFKKISRIKRSFNFLQQNFCIQTELLKKNPDFFGVSNTSTHINSVLLNPKMEKSYQIGGNKPVHSPQSNI